tara:strand:- start:623 stop:2761 length:2139 start_codon:yes stop_codon:yes gene_type:complete
MQHISEIIEDILIEWAYRVHDGMPNPQNALHIQELRESMEKLNIPNDVIYGVIKNLITEKEEEDRLSDEEKEKAKKMGLISLGYGNWGKEKGGKATHKSEKGKLVKVGKEEKPDSETQTTSISATPFKKDNKSSEDTKGRNISDKNKKIVNDFDKRVNDRKENLNPDQQKLMNESLEKIEILYDDDASEEQKKEAAEWLVNNAGFSTNANGKKAYLNKLGGNRKIISGDAGTSKSADLVKKVSSYTELKTYDAKGVKQGFTTAAKPDLGDDNIVKPKDDKGVADYFSNHPILQKIRGGLHGIYGVIGEDGKIKMPSSEHSRDYLKQSFNNPALQNTIDFAKQQVEAGNVDEKVVTTLENHQNNLQNILDNYEIPSEEAQQAIADSYNDLMVGLHKSDSDIASSIMKQIAENNLYEQELANGEEVYLPSAGNFPAGDKIKGGTTERVALVSCKFGRAGRIYGCPANSKTICELHPSESKRNNQGQYLGEDGHTLLINDDLIKGESKVETKEKTKTFIKDSLKEVGLGNVFSDDEIDEISNISADYMEEIDNIKKELDGMNLPDASSYWKEFGKRVAKIEDEYKQRMGKVVTKEHATALIGENNVPNLVQKGGVKVESVMSAIEIANNIRTNDSLLELEHNKQYYDENGKPKFVTDKGTQNPNDYSITFRTKRTAGRTGGGCQLSFTGDGTPPKNNLQDDGSLTSGETGEEIEV